MGVGGCGKEREGGEGERLEAHVALVTLQPICPGPASSTSQSASAHTDDAAGRQREAQE